MSEVITEVIDKFVNFLMYNHSSPHFQEIMQSVGIVTGG
jgi:hypothetical protein